MNRWYGKRRKKIIKIRLRKGKDENQKYEKDRQDEENK